MDRLKVFIKNSAIFGGILVLASVKFLIFQVLPYIVCYTSSGHYRILFRHMVHLNGSEFRKFNESSRFSRCDDYIRGSHSLEVPSTSGDCNFTVICPEGRNRDQKRVTDKREGMKVEGRRTDLIARELTSVRKLSGAETRSVTPIWATGGPPWIYETHANHTSFISPDLAIFMSP